MLPAHFHDAAGVCSRQWRNFGLFKIMAMLLSHCVMILNSVFYSCIVRSKKINNMFLRHYVKENGAGGWLFIFYFFLMKCYEMMYPSNFPEKVLTFSVLTSQSTNKMAANDGRPKLKICDV